MSTDNSWQYSAYFKLFGKEGLQVSFTVNGDDPDTHIAQLGDYITQLIEAEGFSITPEGIKPGEKLQEVDGWVLGETAEGQPCVHLYKSPLQWKVATVYEERIKDIPIKHDAKTFQWPGAAPEREVAERRGVINPCNFTIVLVPTGKTSDKGNPIFKFDRTVGFGSASAQAKSSAAFAPPAQGNTAQAGRAADVQSYADLYSMLKDEPRKLADWCRGIQRDAAKKGIAGESKVSILCEEIDNATGTEASAEAVLEVLTGIPTIYLRERLKSYVVNGLIKWIAPYVQNGDDGDAVKNPDQRDAIVAAVRYIWGMANGYNEVNQQAGEPAAPAAAKSSRSQKATGQGNSRRREPDVDVRDMEDIPF